MILNNSFIFVLMKNFLKKILDFVKNRYLIATFIFLLVIVFFDKNNILSQYRLFKMLSKVRQEKSYYQDEILKNQKTIHDLNTNPESVEKYAREKYFMKKDSEDIFLIIDKKPAEK